VAPATQGDGTRGHVYCTERADPRDALVDLVALDKAAGRGEKGALLAEQHCGTPGEQCCTESDVCRQRSARCVAARSSGRAPGNPGGICCRGSQASCNEGEGGAFGGQEGRSN